MEDKRERGGGEDPVVPFHLPRALLFGFFFVLIHLNSAELFIGIRSIFFKKANSQRFTHSHEIDMARFESLF